MLRIFKRFLLLVFLRVASVALTPSLLQGLRGSSPFSRPHQRNGALSTLIQIFRRAVVLVFLIVAHIAPASVPLIISILKQILMALQPSPEDFSDGIRDGVSAVQESIHKAGVYPFLNAYSWFQCWICVTGDAAQKVADGTVYRLSLYRQALFIYGFRCRKSSCKHNPRYVLFCWHDN
jgi:hypothetical protein